MPTRSDLENLIACAYEASIDADVWHSFTDTYRTLMAADCATLMHVDGQLSGIRSVCDLSFDPGWLRAYEDYYLSIDVRIAFGRRLANRHPVMSDEILRSYCDYHGSEFYQDYARPQKRHHFMGFIGGKFRDGWLTVLAAQRNGGRGPFNQDENKFHERLKPHVERALQIQHRLSDVIERGREVEAVLDQLGYGVVLLDEEARVLHANAYAEQVFRSGDGLRTRRGVLTAHDQTHARMLQEIFAEIAAGSAGGTVALSRASGDARLNVLVGPVGPLDTFARTKAAKFVLFVTDPDRTVQKSSDHFRSLFGFTPKEAEVAGKLIVGQSTKSIAQEFGLAEDTVRKNLKTMFEKTGTNRQAELVVRLLSAVPPLG